MDVSLLWWVLLAIVLCWAVGLYNRLVRLRVRAVEVLGVIEKHLSVCALQALDSAERVSAMDDERLFALGASLRTAALRLEQLLAKPRSARLQHDAVHALSLAWGGVQTGWVQLHETGLQDGAHSLPLEVIEAWNAAAFKIQSASGGYNQIVQLYNEAIQQYPAKWGAAVLGFRTAGVF